MIVNELTYGAEICLLKSNCDIDSLVRLFDLLEVLLDDDFGLKFEYENYGFFSFLGENCLIQAEYNRNIGAEISLGTSREEGRITESNNLEFRSSNNQFVIIELNYNAEDDESFEDVCFEKRVDPLNFSYVYYLSEYLIRKGMKHAIFVSGSPTDSFVYSVIKDKDYFKIRTFMYLPAMCEGVLENIYFLSSGNAWKKLYRTQSLRKIRNYKVATKDILNGRKFGKIVPLLYIDKEAYLAYLQPYEAIRDPLSLHEKRLRELLQNYRMKLFSMRQISVIDRRMIEQLLINDNLFEALFFLMSVGFLFDTYGRVDGLNIKLFHELCMDYSQGLFQLIENAYYHVVREDAAGGFANVCFRIRSAEKRIVKEHSQPSEMENKNNEQESAGKEYYFEIFVSDMSCKRGPAGIISSLCENYHDLDGSGVTLTDIFEEVKNDKLKEFYTKGKNIAFHYGLQIFTSVVTSNGGEIAVRSGANNDGLYFNTKRCMERFSATAPLPWLRGTLYVIRFPIELEREWINRNDSIARQKLGDLSYTLKEAPIELRYIKKLPFLSAEDKISSITSAFSRLKEIEFLDDELIYRIDCSRITTEYQFELLAKTVFLALTEISEIKRLALVNLQDRNKVIKLFRQFALFYDRTGNNKNLEDKIVFIVDRNAEMMFFLRDKIDNVVEDFQRLQIVGGIDDAVFRIVQHLGGRNSG